ncbi:LacI family DNA-binding transcriptional regulator [Paenarthrobacter ilicis]|uniref:LacI family DNA-binding transcriptional regulator n=1 Tax=Paenarthrobacter ilicis TaxID=43665 RepID=UPI003867815A
MTDFKHSRMTQKRIAELAGVSQSLVSLVLNKKFDGAAARIPDETRQRVLDVVGGTNYVPDPAARRLVGVGNKIIGVFTYEPAFPRESLDFYTPLLTGIEAQAESAGCDLLLFTSAPVVDGHRKLFHEKSMLALADGCLLLGLEMDGAELARLVDSGFPFVAIGRRDTAGVAYVGVDYVSATASAMRSALALGHERFFYLHLDSVGESVMDRQRGFLQPLTDLPDGAVEMLATDGSNLESDWAAIREFEPTALVVEMPSHAQRIHNLATRDGVSVPSDLSMIVLGEPSLGIAQDIDFTRLCPPRTELGAQAVTLLSRIISHSADPPAETSRILLECPIADGSTLAKAPRSA